MPISRSSNDRKLDILDGIPQSEYVDTEEWKTYVDKELKEKGISHETIDEVVKWIVEEYYNDGNGVETDAEEETYFNSRPRPSKVFLINNEENRALILQHTLANIHARLTDLLVSTTPSGHSLQWTISMVRCVEYIRCCMDINEYFYAMNNYFFYRLRTYKPSESLYSKLDTETALDHHNALMAKINCSEGDVCLRYVKGLYQAMLMENGISPWNRKGYQLDKLNYSLINNLIHVCVDEAITAALRCGKTLTGSIKLYSHETMADGSEQEIEHIRPIPENTKVYCEVEELGNIFSYDDLIYEEEIVNLYRYTCLLNGRCKHILEADVEQEKGYMIDQLILLCK